MDKVGKMLVPAPFVGTLSEFKKHKNLHIGYEWLTKIDNPNVYLNLFECWIEHDLDNSYNLHIVSFHLEAVNVKWLEQQSRKIDGQIIVLFDGSSNDYTIPKVRFLPYYYWHIQLDRIFKWFNLYDQPTPNKNITHKASAICNRIQTNKLLVFTALAEYLNRDDSMLVLSDWLGNDVYKINYNEKLELLYELFFKKYFGQIIKIDDFTNKQNYQSHTANPMQSYLQNCAIHFTNESFSTTALSLIESPYNNALRRYPGPFITEKTFKCIAGCTTFIPVGQYDTYGCLERLGFNFDYNFDTSFDSTMHDGHRLEKIVNLIESFVDVDCISLYNQTKSVTEQNYNYVKAKVFYNEIEKLNSYTAEQVIEHIKQTA